MRERTTEYCSLSTDGDISTLTATSELDRIFDTKGLDFEVGAQSHFGEDPVTCDIAQLDRYRFAHSPEDDEEAILKGVDLISEN